MLSMTATDIAAGPLSELEHRVQLRRAVIASTIGTTIEWYDFFLQHGHWAGLREAVFSGIRSSGRNIAGLRHLRRRLLSPVRSGRRSSAITAIAWDAKRR